MMRWTVADMPAQSGRTVVVTGASSGLGLADTAALAGAGARVVMGVRDLDKGRRAAEGITGTVEVRRLDLTDLGSVREFAAGLDGPVDVLVNNAGVMAVPHRETTADGFELQMATNHFGHFVLTNLLLDRLTDRVVTVSSQGHRMGGLDLDDLHWERRRYSPWLAYGQTKLANLLFTLELQRRLHAEGSPVRAMAAHPGAANTDLFRSPNRLAQRVNQVVVPVLAQSADKGALPTLFAATEDLPGGSYAGPGGPGEVRGRPVLVGRSADASDPRLARALWVASEAATAVGYRDTAPARAV